ncbi:hypothetical protein [Gandjariella thermophila]|uniref:Uncharacterized protein n=1 Tax=Gandjariella thermophila TaxID=1931992 RepID=A0A4D4JCA7_9PSEU|nr:hypothetical protein [Gandjariella thermophila]GDY33234.1 hypothetical protein GTS_48670 [Gandjariella thermophila]
MGLQGAKIAAIVAERGIPDPWDSFGACMDANAGHVNRIRAAIETCRKDPTDTHRAAVTAEFVAARAKLDRATGLVRTALTDLDADGGWAALDARAARLDIDDVCGPEWGLPRFNHPYRVIQESLRFNWTYMKQHGVRAFYEMTLRYLDDLHANLDVWQRAWETEQTTGTRDHLVMLDCELVALEAPMHCGVCRKTIAPLLYLDN